MDGDVGDFWWVFLGRVDTGEEDSSCFGVVEPDAMCEELVVQGVEAAAEAIPEHPLIDRGGKEAGIIGVLDEVCARWGDEVSYVECEEEGAQDGSLWDSSWYWSGGGECALYSHLEGSVLQVGAEEVG